VIEKKESDFLYEILFKSAASKKKTTLSNIKNACNHLENNAKKLSPASVGNFCFKKYGTPREQSIRNNPEEFVKYIELREKERTKIIVDHFNSDEPILVKDQAAQLIINKLQEEKKDLNRTISNLKKGMRQISPIDIDRYISENLGEINKPSDLVSSTNMDITSQENVNHDTLTELLIKDIVKELNKNVLEKYSEISIDYKNGKIFNNLTGVVYWEKTKI
jgi:hypothetical protein